MAISRFQKVPDYVARFFNKSSQKVFTLEQLDIIFRQNNINWSLPLSNVEDFEKQLIQSNVIQAAKFVFDERVKTQMRFWSRDADLYDVAITLIPNTHLSHCSALFLHNIITTPPTVIYLTAEQSAKAGKSKTRELLQEDVDSAFSKQLRNTSARCNYAGIEIVFLNGMFTNKAGVIDVADKPVTSLERTLIDITVRPSYCGGAVEVLKAFENSKNKIDVDALISLLDSIHYTYPYYQSIGFYLEKAGYDAIQLSKLKKRKKYIDFYLDHEMEHPAYSKDWRLYYPKALHG